MQNQVKSALEMIPDSDWERLAELARKHGHDNVDATTVRKQYIEYAQSITDPGKIEIMVKDESAEAADCIRKSFQLRVGAAGLSGHVDYCASGGSWSAPGRVFFSAGGFDFQIRAFELTPEAPKQYFRVAVGDDFGIAEIDVCFVLTGGKPCFGIRGEVCYRWYWTGEMYCAGVDHTISCFPQSV
ncbi:hypothetical protein [Streptosporangium sp. NPDC000396]|uniref:hypothetical protein n=1 Tax=Streptosporangium sp. NPDC000396 TaxID=3366185 RepID=UPI00368B5848